MRFHNSEDGDADMKRSIQILLMLLAILGSGFAAGWFLRPLGWNMVEDANRRSAWQSGDAGERVEAFMSAFGDEIDLTPDQAARIEPLVETFMHESNRVRSEYLRKKKVGHDKTVTGIRELLDAGQQQKMDALIESSEKRFQKALGDPGEE